MTLWFFLVKQKEQKGKIKIMQNSNKIIFALYH